MCIHRKKTKEAVEPKSPLTERSQKLSQNPSGGITPIANPNPGTIRSQSTRSPGEKCQSAPNSVRRAIPGGRSNVTTGAGSTSVSHANTPAGEQQKQEVIPVEPPKKMLARRTIDKVRDARDPDYKTLEIGGSIWEAAVIVKREDMKNEGKKNSDVMSRKSRKA